MIVGLTGGIGSGKSTVAAMFRSFGVPVYISDIEAKILTSNSLPLREKLTQLLGDAIFNDGILDRKYMAKKIFNSRDLLDKTNAIIHPYVERHFLKWAQDNEAPYCIKEAAILFENGGYKKCDKIILVTAPKEVRIARVMQRDGTSRKLVEKIMAQQWEDEKKIEMADIVIENIDKVKVYEEVKILHRQFLHPS